MEKTQNLYLHTKLLYASPGQGPPQGTSIQKPIYTHEVCFVKVRSAISRGWLITLRQTIMAWGNSFWPFGPAGQMRGVGTVHWVRMCPLHQNHAPRCSAGPHTQWLSSEAPCHPWSPGSGAGPCTTLRPLCAGIRPYCPTQPAHTGIGLHCLHLALHTQSSMQGHTIWPTGLCMVWKFCSRGVVPLLLHWKIFGPVGSPTVPGTGPTLQARGWASLV